jgi:hypothetical protein
VSESIWLEMIEPGLLVNLEGRLNSIAHHRTAYEKEMLSDQRHAARLYRRALIERQRRGFPEAVTFLQRRAAETSAAARNCYAMLRILDERAS